MNLSFQFIFALLVGWSYIASVDSNVIGIDFASDSMKVAIVQPGTPLEIGKHYS